MSKLLGEINNKEQYIDVPKEICHLSDSIKVKRFIEKHNGIKNIFVAPVMVEISSLTCRNLLCWAGLRSDLKEIITLIPVFNTSFSLIKNSEIISIELLDKEYYYIWKGNFYCVLGTSKGEVVVKKVHGIWTEGDVRNFMKIKAPETTAPDIFPVELFSISKHNFICAAWAVCCEDIVYWYPVQWDDYDKLQKYGSKDVEMLPINVGDVTQAGNIRFEILYNEALGLYFEKTDKPLSWHHLVNQEQKEKKVIDLSSSVKTKKKAKKNKEQKTLILPLCPKED